MERFQGKVCMKETFPKSIHNTNTDVKSVFHFPSLLSYVQNHPFTLFALLCQVQSLSQQALSMCSRSCHVQLFLL